MQIILAFTAPQACRLSHKHPEALVFDIRNREVWRHGVFIHFQPGQFRSFLLIAARRGGLVPKDDIFEALYGDDPDGGPDFSSKILEVRISAVRKVIPAIGVRIETEWGQGYRLHIEEMPSMAAIRRAA